MGLKSEIRNQKTETLLFVVLAALPCAAGEPHIGYLYPAGGQQGTVVQVTVGGQYLGGTASAHLTGDGVHVAFLKHTRALSQGTLNQLRDKLAEATVLERRRQAALDEGDTRLAGGFLVLIAKTHDEFENLAFKLGIEDSSPRGLAELNRRLSDPKRQLNPQIEETVTLRLTISPGAPPGERELRLRTGGGFTNPLFFHVGQCREYMEKEPNDRTPDAEVLTETIADIEFAGMGSLPIILNGQVMPGDVDRFRFSIKKGTRLVAAVSARSLVPYLADAVPGWFQATLRLLDARGTELAFCDDFRFHPDPIIYYEIPKGGDYILEIYDAIYRGREDFVYRITVGDLPLITSVFPLGAKAGSKTSVALDGWNLPTNALTLDAEKQAPGSVPLTVSKEKRVSNAVTFPLDALPECLEAEPNSEPPKAQQVQLPIIVNGRIDAPGDWDLFRFQGRAGDQVVAEVVARRLGSPLDSLLKLTDASGKELAINDDWEDKAAGLTTHHSDSFLLAKLPADGVYTVHVGDTQRQGGAAHAYRLRISTAEPDFQLRVVPSAINIRPGVNHPIAVYALRRDGFSGAIALRLKDMPDGFALGGACIPANQESVRLTLTLPPTAPAKPMPMRLEGCATIAGAEVSRTAVPADDMMQAFAYHHLVASRDGILNVLGGRGSAPPVKPLAEGPVKLPAGGTGRAQLSVPKGDLAKELRIELDDPPKGFAIKELVPEGDDKVALVLAVDAKEAKPGLAGNLILNAFQETPIKSADGKTQTGTRRTALGTLTALPFEVTAPPPPPPPPPKSPKN